MKKPNIVFLDAKPLINDDLSLEVFYQIGQVKVYNETPPEKILEHALNANILITSKVKLTEAHFCQLPDLQYVGETATGVDNIDLAGAKKHHIIVTNVPDYSTTSVAQHVFACLLHYTNQIEPHHLSVQRGEWTKQSYFSYWMNPPLDLTEQTLGLVGFGKVGQRVSEIAQIFGMNVLAYKPKPFNHPFVKWVSFNELLKRSDIISLHCPLNPNTKEIMNNESLSLMKPNSILINTGRGGLINELALAAHLKSKKIAQAYLDVLSVEPPPPNHPLLGLDNCIITPHIAWASKESRKRLLKNVYENIIHFLKGQPQNVVYLT